MPGLLDVLNGRTLAKLSRGLVVEQEPASVPELAEIEDLVREDLERRRGDLALLRYLDDLREQIPITIDPSLFQTAGATSP